MDMMDDWDHVASDVRKLPDPNVILIGHVDCSKKDVGDPLCKQLGITNLPTLLYFDPPLAPSEINGTAYTGNHTYTMLRRFARSLMCNADFPDQYCSKKQRALMPKYLAMPDEERQLQLAELQQALAQAEREHKAVADELQERYLASEKALSELKAELSRVEDVITDIETWWISKKSSAISNAISRKFSSVDRALSRMNSALVAAISPYLPVWMGGTAGQPAGPPPPQASHGMCEAHGHAH